MATTTLENELSLMTRILAPERATLSPEAARLVLAMEFPKPDQDRMVELSDKANEEELTSEEQAEVDAYMLVGHWLSIMHSKARMSLRDSIAHS